MTAALAFFTAVLSPPTPDAAAADPSVVKAIYSIYRGDSRLGGHPGAPPTPDLVMLQDMWQRVGWTLETSHVAYESHRVLSPWVDEGHPEICRILLTQLIALHMALVDVAYDAMARNGADLARQELMAGHSWMTPALVKGLVKDAAQEALELVELPVELDRAAQRVRLQRTAQRAYNQGDIRTELMAMKAEAVVSGVTAAEVKDSQTQFLEAVKAVTDLSLIPGGGGQHLLSDDSATSPVSSPSLSQDGADDGA